MTNIQSWTMSAIGAAALVVGVILVTGASGFAQEDSPTPTPQGDTPTATPEAAEDSADATPVPESTDDLDGGSEEAVPQGRGGCVGGGHLAKGAAAEILGMTEDELRVALSSAQTLAEVAQAQGISVDDFTAQLQASIIADLDEKLAAGDITQERYDEIVAGLPEKLDTMINSTPGDGVGFRGPPRGEFPGEATRFAPGIAQDDDASDA